MKTRHRGRSRFLVWHRRPGRPPENRKRLGAEVSAALRDPAVEKQISAYGWQVATNAKPEEFGAFLRAELDRFGAIMKAKGIEKEE